MPGLATTAPPIQLWIEPTLPAGWPPDGLGPLDALTGQLPAADTLPAGAWVAVRAARAPGSRGLLARLLGSRPAEAHLALRCTALLARGYEQVGAGLDDRGQVVAWGRVPPG
jgi:hypothetical protein